LVQQPILISASQLANFRDCPRKWAFEKLDLIERPETAATQDGTLIHKQLEDWYRDGIAPTRPEAQAVLTHTPSRAEHLSPEQEFQFTWPGVPALCRGYMDLVDPATQTVHDYKTARDINRSAKTPEDLLLDAQGVIYGAAYRLLHGPVPVVNLQWTYVQREQPKTRPPKTKPVRAAQGISEMEAGIAHWTPVVQELYQIATKHTKAADVPANRSACFKYGPCPFREVCLDFGGRSEPQPEEAPMDPAVLAALASASKTKPVVKATPEPEAAPMANQPPPMDRLAALEADFGAVPAIVPPDAQPNVTPSDPPAPPVQSGPAPKAKRGRGKAAPAPADTPATTQALEEVSSFDIESFVADVVERAAKESDIEVQLEAARIGMDLLQYRKVGG
jgi:hypothetical protein